MGTAPLLLVLDNRNDSTDYLVYLVSDDRPLVYQEGENWIYRASGSGNCIRYLVAAALGYEDQRGKKWDDLLDRSAKEGHLHEDSIINTLEDAGEVQVVGAQEEVNVQIIPKVFLRGHIEGLLEYRSGKQELLEIKSMSTKQFTKWVNGGFDRFPNYAYQISGYMEAYPKLDCRYIVKRREDGFNDERVIQAGSPPIPFSAVRKKIVLAEKYRRKGKLPPCDVDQQWGCPVWYLHDEGEEEEVEPLTEDMQEILGELVSDYLRLKEIEDKGKEAEKSRKKINPEILNMLGKLDQTDIQIGKKKYRVTRRRSGNTRIDKAKVLAIIGEEKLEEVQTNTRFQYPVIREIE